ncbi:MAG TPA: gliding motility-associated C-terminal domain-containing protein [Chitinophagaceae bacterium]|nr:gliding motility-associated C-terminal domain-containing protein [Chitinophagaceae bacterium]
MIYGLLKYGLFVGCLLIFSHTFSQSQICPANINFASGTLTHWYAYTGNNQQGNGPSAIMQRFDSTQPAPAGTIGATAIPEYQLPFVNGIQLVTTAGTDPYGGFTTIPTINGYSYNYSLLLGSTAVRGGGQDRGGYIRGISYAIQVPPGPPGEPYTITYAYAMVLENGSHSTREQPIFTATVATTDSVLRCASATYNLPTRFIGIGPNSRGFMDSLFEIDQSIAANLGFRLSPVASPNDNGNGNESRMRVWTQGWKEVTFDLAPYRGRTVSLTFEADNCIPGGHFSYAYIAIRNVCEGLIISGPPDACINTSVTYSIPALAGATYNWQVPAGWSIVSGSNSNILTVIPGTTTGSIIAHEVNGCANLRDTLPVTVRPPTLAGDVNSDDQVCEGTNSTALTLSGERGNILNWLSSTDGIRWDIIPNTTNAYTAQDITTTTVYRALVQNGSSCSIDTSAEATIIVDPRSVGGRIDPAGMDFCLGQDRDARLTLNGKVGSVQFWESSQDAINWSSFIPSVDTAYDVPSSTTQSTQYRAIVKSGVCPADTSTIAGVNVVNIPYPRQTIYPRDTTICYDDTARLNSLITIGTSYTWTNINTLTGPAGGSITGTPFLLTNEAHPLSTTRYILSIRNAGCPNLLRDTFQVQVLPPVLVNAGADTSIVYDQPLQLQALTNYTSGLSFNWSPSTGLDNQAIYNPVARLGISIDSVHYTVRATTTIGCYSTDDILVRVFKTLPDIFVPNAFTPGRGTNTLFRPIPVGIVSLDYFRVYNRWGQLVYNSTNTRNGWDGRVGGKDQSPGTYVWMVQGRDYTGRTVFRKGTMVLIR